MPDTTKHTRPYQPSPQPACERSEKVAASVLTKLLDEWMQGDEVEQRETFEALRHSLDENRPEGYKLFS